MAKHVYSPELSSIWGSINDFLELEDPTLPAFIPKVIAMLQARDHALENALLGDLVVNSVSGTAGSVTPPLSKQIGWLMNTGTISGVADADGYFQITYSHAFPIDTVVPMFVSTVSDPINLLGLTPQVVAGTPNKFGFKVAIGAPGDPAQGCYLAIGF